MDRIRMALDNIQNQENNLLFNETIRQLTLSLPLQWVITILPCHYQSLKSVRPRQIAYNLYSAADVSFRLATIYMANQAKQYTSRIVICFHRRARKQEVRFLPETQILCVSTYRYSRTSYRVL
jgi:hypothetical protein